MVWKNFICGVLIGLFSLTGCGDNKNISNQSHELTETEISTNIIEEQNEWTQKFNDSLGNITDEQSAEVAVDEFINYMADRFEPTSNELGTQSIVSSNRQLLKSAFEGKKLAHQELTKRLHPLSSQSENANLISLKDFADQLNMAQKQIEVTELELITLRDGIRQLIPNITTTPENPNISELESMVISWVFSLEMMDPCLQENLGNLIKTLLKR